MSECVHLSETTYSDSRTVVRPTSSPGRTALQPLPPTCTYYPCPSLLSNMLYPYFGPLSSDELSKSGMHLTEWLLPDVRYINPSSHYDTPREPSQHSRDDQQGIRHFAPFNLAYRTKLGYFDWLELPGHAHKLKRVEHSMTGTAGWEVKGEVLRGTPRLSSSLCEDHTF